MVQCEPGTARFAKKIAEGAPVALNETILVILRYQINRTIKYKATILCNIPTKKSSNYDIQFLPSKYQPQEWLLLRF